MLFDGVREAKLPNNTSFQNDSFPTNTISYATRPQKGVELGHIIYMLAALFGLGVSNACLAIRLSSIRETHAFHQLTSTHIIVLTIYFLGCSFCISSSLLYFGHTIYDQASCQAAIFLGLSFYFFQKYLLYFFLVERTHSARARSKSRLKDKTYLAGVVFLVFGFAGLGAASFALRIAEYNEDSETCKIGLPRRVASVLLGWDIFVNTFLTFVFLRHVRQFMVQGIGKSIIPQPILRLIDNFLLFVKPGQQHNSQDDDGHTISTEIQQGAILRVIRKALLGCVLVMAGTVANFSVLLYYAGKESAWMFFTFSTLDVTWAVVIIHWLTNSPGEMGSRHSTNTGLSGSGNGHRPGAVAQRPL